MAKEFKMKLQIDTGGAVKELEGTIDTISGFDKQLSALQDKLNNTKIGTEEYKKLQKEYDRTAKAAENVKNANKGWLDTIASAPGLVGTLGQSLQGVGKAFGNFNMLLKTSLVGFIAAAVVELVNQFKKMEGVMDPLNKVASIFSGVMSQLANTVLPLVVAPLEGIAFLLEKVSNLFGGAGSELADLADRQDALSDSTAEYELQQSKANRALQEAREKAADSTLSIKERKQALQDAEKEERNIAAAGKARALEQARIVAGQLATTLGLSKDRIDAIKKYDAAQLESFTKEIAQRKGLNQEQRTQLLQQLGTIQEIDAQTAKIGKKTAAGIKAIDNEAAAAAKEAAQKRLEAQKNELNAQIELEKNKANTSEKVLRELLEKKDKLENQGTKKSKAELELQAQNRDKAIKDALKADTDANKQTTDEAKKLEDDKIKILVAGTKQRIDEKNVELEKTKILYGEDSAEYKKQQNQIIADRQAALEEEKNAINAKKELSKEDVARLNAIKIEAGNLSNQVLANNQKEIKDAAAKVEAQKAIDAAELEYKMQKAEGDFELQRSIIAEQEELERQAYERAIAAAGDDKVKKEQIELDYTKKKDGFTKARMDISDKEYQSQIKQAQGIANALGALSDLVGKDTIAGKALGISQALINTYVGASEVLKAKAVLPEPANTIVKIANLATTIATGLKTVREIMAVQVPTNEVPEVRIRKAMGGVLQGPTHQMGGIATPFGELEGGEYVINRASTMMFRPALDRINALGGGAVDYQAQGFAPSAVASEPPIIKTYVVASEMSSQQELDRIIKDRSKF